jgi:acetyl esterase
MIAVPGATMAQLDPQVRMIVEGMRRAKTPPLSSYPVEKARDVYDKGLRLLDLAPDPAVKTEIRELAGPGGPMRAQVHHPVGIEPFSGPVLAWLHGGGYCVGSSEGAVPLCHALALHADCTVVSVDYRLAPEHPFPAAVDDAVASYRALLDGVGNESAGRIALAGDSAGATLALVAALLAREIGVPLPGALMLVTPTALGRRETESRREFAEGYFLGMADMRWFFENYTAGTDLDHDFRFAPIAARDFTMLPPTFIAAAQCDPLRDDATALAEALARDGVDVECRLYPGMTHGFFQMGGIVQRAREAHREAALFLKGAWALSAGS